MRLLRVYPAAWRARYGNELATLIEELNDGARLSWRGRLDVVRAGLGERLRVLTFEGRAPREQAREGSLLVLYAWTLFVLGGFGIQKASEHWQAVTPTNKQGLPSAAFNILLIAAGVGSALVLIGIALSLPRVAALIRQGGWRKIRQPIIRATALSLLAVAATVGLANWAHSLTPAARNGHNAAYSGAFLAWVILLAACVFAWAASAAITARHLSFSPRVLRLEVGLGAGVTTTMTVMTIATATWWASLASDAPWFFDGHPIGSNASALVANMIVPVALMLGATTLALIGAKRGIRALASISALPRSS